ncbi:MAG TPA: ThiF family adenylyltransferase [Candidatus Limnocylindrales bacterium]|nr:ThiF family adenylyltransferase [Candidatus Limnocylindrales bacterium]
MQEGILQNYVIDTYPSTIVLRPEARFGWLVGQTSSFEVTPINAKSLLKGSDLVVDTFDNWTSRIAIGKECSALGIPCIHAGMSDDGFAEVKWNEVYKYGSIIADEAAALPEAPCNVALSRSLILMVVCTVAEIIAIFIRDGRRFNREITLADIRVFDPGT